MFKNINHDCMNHIIFFLDGQDIKKLKNLNKDFYKYIDQNADIIFCNLIKNKFKFYQFKTSYLFRKDNYGISINKDKQIRNNLDLLIDFNVI